VDVSLVAVGRASDLEQDARREPGLQVRAVADPEVSFEGDPARKRLGFPRSQAPQLFREQRLEATRAGSEESLRAHGRFSMMN
jgi:hypothetical protein